MPLPPPVLVRRTGFRFTALGPLPSVPVRARTEFVLCEVMLKDFRTYQLALQFHQVCQTIKGPYYLIDQLRRASSSIALNLSEGSERVSNRDRRNFYQRAMGSARECETLVNLLVVHTSPGDAKEIGDKLRASLFKLLQTLDFQAKTKNSPAGTEGGGPRAVNRKPKGST